MITEKNITSITANSTSIATSSNKSVKSLFGQKSIDVQIEEGIAYQKSSIYGGGLSVPCSFEQIINNYSAINHIATITNDMIEKDILEKKEKEIAEQKKYVESLQNRLCKINSEKIEQKNVIDEQKNIIDEQNRIIDYTKARSMYENMKEAEKAEIEKKANAIEHERRIFLESLVSENTDNDEYNYEEADYENLRSAGISKEIAKQTINLNLTIYLRVHKFDEEDSIYIAYYNYKDYIL